MNLASCIPELVDCLVTSVALLKNLFLIAMFLLLRFLKKFILWVREKKIFGTSVRNCALVICESKILFRRCSVLPTLELLWTKLVELRRCQSKQAILFPLVNQIAGEKIHAVCSYYRCTFFICMN